MVLRRTMRIISWRKKTSCGTKCCNVGLMVLMWKLMLSFRMKFYQVVLMLSCGANVIPVGYIFILWNDMLSCGTEFITCSSYIIIMWSKYCIIMWMFNCSYYQYHAGPILSCGTKLAHVIIWIKYCIIIWKFMLSCGQMLSCGTKCFICHTANLC